MEDKITGRTELFVLLGNPVEHSKSPEMYNYAFGQLGMDKRYIALTAEEEDMANTMLALKTLGVKGGNLTMPVKTIGAQLVDELTDSARLIGAVNTFKINEGMIYGHNTDGIGFINNLRQNGHEIKGKKAVLLGSGAAATAIAVQAVLDGVQELSIFSMKDKFYAKIEALVGKLSAEFPQCTITCNDLAEEALLADKVLESQFLFNATKVGMVPMENQSLIKDTTVLHAGLVVADTIYNPTETQLIKDAKEANVLATFGGIGMLIYQGEEGFRFMTGEQLPVQDIMKTIYGL